jgi:hypothetical protein
MELPPDRCEGIAFVGAERQMRNCGNVGIRWVDDEIRKGVSLRLWMCQGPCEWVVAE